MAKAKAEKSASPEMALVMDMMRKKRDVTFAEVRDAAKAKGMTIYPISYGRAQYSLGIVRKGKKKKAAAAAASGTAAPAKRGPGRPPKATSAMGAMSAPVKRGPGRPPKARAMASSGDPLAALQGIAEEMASLKRALADIAEIARQVSTR